MDFDNIASNTISFFGSLFELKEEEK